jgi:hypothetical protein
LEWRVPGFVLQAEGLEPVGDVQLYQYHPPFTYGWQRVNEVLFVVKEKTAAAAAATTRGGGSRR